MRLILVTFGSLGDLHPVIAVALELRRRGHEPVIATSEPYRVKIAALGLPFAAVRPDLSLSDAAMVRRVMNGPRGSAYLMRRLVYPSVRDMHADLSALAADADVLVSSELACAAPIVAAQRTIRWAFFALSPVSFFPAFDPPVLPGPAFVRRLQALGPAVNRCVFRTAKLVSHAWWRPVRQFRRELGLPAGRSPLFEGKFSPQLNLALFSRTLQPPQPDWPASTVQTGFCFFDEDAGAARGALPGPVAQFLAAGEPPLVFTLGSAAVHLARDFYVQSALAAQQLDRRALLLLGKNPAPADLPPTILAWDYLPYAAIFPRAAAIVHQGGVGTTAQALRAGRPMLVVPFAHDQFDNAARAVRIGSAATLARRRYRAPAVAAALRALTSDPRYATNAAAVAARVREEDGARQAAAALEALAK